MRKYSIGIDVGGSHISCAFVDEISGQIVEKSRRDCAIDSQASISEISESFKQALMTCIQSSPELNYTGVGIAMPGPFDYPAGISKISGVQKFDALFGVNFKLMIEAWVAVPVTFINDATCFALGEYYGGAGQGSERTIVVTLGTGFGSTFLVNGKVQGTGDCGVPDDGYLYNVPFGNSIADDYFSTRWFVNQFGAGVSGVKEIATLAKQGNAKALDLFKQFAANLAEIMSPFFTSFQADTFVLGGSIAKASPLFLDDLKNNLKAKGITKLSIKPCELEDLAPVIGAAMCAATQIQAEKNRRNTQQFLAPTKASPVDTYDIYPGFPIGNNKINEGATAIATWMAQQQTVIMDGYVGVFWEDLVSALNAELLAMGKTVRWFHASAALKPSTVIDEMLIPYLGGDDPVFGKVTDKQLSDWFNTEQLQQMTPDPSVDLNVVVGCGASLSGWEGSLIYVDLPKNEIQFRMRAQAANNLGATTFKDNKQMYKRFFFVDWKVLNDHKCAILPQIDLIIDAQRPNALLSMTGHDLRDGLKQMSTNFFRCRPWFEPGAWGGSWMKEHIKQLNPDVENLAWSFELMVLENGIMFESNDYRLEVSFDFLMFNNYQEVLGDCADRFQYDFPIRFDFLDTIDGGNLSVQCHPRNEYIQKEFNMPFTQDETYYILDSKGTADVYLGFQEGINPEAFHQALVSSQENSEPIDITQYVQKHDAKKHDLFLIPNGTVHASGSGNLVLEISSAPYIFTFKMYDWMRLDLDGKPRPINIEHGMKNLYFDRQGAKVQQELICHPYLMEETKDYQLEHLPTHPEHFYDVHRYHFQDKITMACNNKCHVWMLVEGQSVLLETASGLKQQFNYAETFVIPAAAQNYTLKNLSKSKAMMVLSFVK